SGPAGPGPGRQAARAGQRRPRRPAQRGDAGGGGPRRPPPLADGRPRLLVHADGHRGPPRLRRHAGAEPALAEWPPRRRARGGPAHAAGRAARAGGDPQRRSLPGDRRDGPPGRRPPVLRHRRPGAAGPGAAQPGDHPGGLRRRPGRRHRPARCPPLVPAGAHRAGSRAGGSGVHPGRPGARRRRDRRRGRPAMSPDDTEAPDGPPRGVATMAVVRWGLVVLTALVAAGSILGYAGVHLTGRKSAPSAQLYYCPMHPSVVQDHPGECPICSMTLVPKPQGQVKPSSTMAPPPGGAEAPGLSAVDLSADRVQLIGMRTAPVKRETLGGELRTVGVVAPSERGLAQISIRFSGWIEKLLVSETGERVRRGQVLATVYSPEVLRAEQELLVARGWTGSEGPAAEHHGTSAGFSADARRRMELLGISAQEVDQILRTGKPVEAISIRSPVEGYVVAKR